MEHSRPGGPLHRAVEPELALWTPDTFLAATVADAIHGLQWQTGGGKGPKPKPLPRPKARLGSDQAKRASLPLAELKRRLPSLARLGG